MVNTGEHTLLLSPIVEQTYIGCVLEVTDHGGNTGTKILPAFFFSRSCGDGVIAINETCDE